jgi:hypothetical protein
MTSFNLDSSSWEILHMEIKYTISKQISAWKGLVLVLYIASQNCVQLYSISWQDYFEWQISNIYQGSGLWNTLVQYRNIEPVSRLRFEQIPLENKTQIWPLKHDAEKRRVV